MGWSRKYRLRKRLKQQFKRFRLRKKHMRRSKLPITRGGYWLRRRDLHTL